MGGACCCWECGGVGGGDAGGAGVGRVVGVGLGEIGYAEFGCLVIVLW